MFSSSWHSPRRRSASFAIGARRCSRLACVRLWSCSRFIRENEVRPGDQALRPPLPPRAASSRSTARPAIRRACCLRAGTSACGAGSTRSSNVPLVDGAARRDRARRRGGRRAIPAERILGTRGRLRQLPGRRGVPRERRRERPPARASSRPASTASTRRCSTSITARPRAAATACTPSSCTCSQVPPDRVGIVTALDGRPIPAGDLAGPIVAGHDSFQRGQAFIDAGGCRGCRSRCCCPARGT